MIHQSPDEKRARSSSSTGDRGLTTFLQDEIHPREGKRIVLPLLTTTDRLRLSECSQGLMNYRYSLSRVKIVPSNKSGPEQLLRGQRGLEYLRVGHASMLHVLDLGCFRGLKTLDLSQLEVAGEEGLGYVTRALEGGGLEGLEELNLSHCSLGEEGIKAVLALLKAGVCPQLRRLKMMVRNRQASGHALAEALESGHLRHLQELDLSYNNLGQRDGGAAIAKALLGGACPQLAKLHLRSCRLSEEAGRTLGEAMRSGACAKLEDLDLDGNPSMKDQGYMAILGALEAGSCPSLKLKQLNLSLARLSVQSATALGHALRSGHCHHLQQLELLQAFQDPAASRHVIQAIQQGTVPNLLSLDLGGTHMDQERGRMLGAAIGRGALPMLEELWIGRNKSGCVVPIMAGLEQGGCPRLDVLEVGEVAMGPQASRALARALASGNLSCLQRFHVSANQKIGDEAMAEVITRLRGCHQLRELNVSETSMGVMAGQALVQALQDKAWPNLEKLDATGNVDLLRDEGVVVGLVGVLNRRTELYPQWTKAWFETQGLDQEGEAGGELARLLEELEEEY